MEDKHLLIVGAGLVGSLLGLRLLQRGYKVSLLELRPDLRSSSQSAGRSINLALSHRGLRGLELVGLRDKAMELSVKMRERMIHSSAGQLMGLAYSAREGEYINSISRKALNCMLMDAIDQLDPKALQFESKLLDWNPQQQTVQWADQNGIVHKLDNVILLGTDGANSQCRKLLMEQSQKLRFNYSQSYQNYGYKELTLPPGPGGEFLIKKEALHIWPRGHFMMIALPNPDASFTCTLFFPYRGEDSFEILDQPDLRKEFFDRHFSDMADYFEIFNEEYEKNPIGHLYTVKCSPWSYEDKMLLMGDAAHAIIPFYGQGMNCGFEDVVVFDEMLNQNKDWLSCFQSFEKARKINSDAIADLAEDNFLEMRDKVADLDFQKKRTLEIKLEKEFSDYFSKYSLVTFRPDVSYHDAMQLGRKQDEYLLQVVKNEKDIDSINPLILIEQLRALR